MDFATALAEAQTWMDEVEGVQGVAEGELDGERCITVFVAGPDAADKIPAQLAEHKVVVEHSGLFDAQAAAVAEAPLETAAAVTEIVTAAVPRADDHDQD